MNEDNVHWCYVIDDGRPVGVGIQVQAPNHFVRVYCNDTAVSDKAKGNFKIVR